MPRESKKKRKSCESLIKAREALIKLKESDIQEVPVETSSVLDQQASESSLSISEATSSSSLHVLSPVHTPLTLGETAGSSAVQPGTSPGEEDVSEVLQEDQPTPEESAHPRTRAEMMDDFCEDWLTALDRDDKKSLAIFLCHVFVKQFAINNTDVSKYLYVY